MAKQQRTVLICDRCKVEHNCLNELCLNVRAQSSAGYTLVDWKDCCPACSVQITDILKGLIIDGTTR